MYDAFFAPLRCPDCGRVTPDAEIQTHIRAGSADSSTLRIDYEFDPFDLTDENIVATGYKLITPPSSDGPIRLLDVWICSYCGTEQWAVVEIVDRKVRAIEAVKLDRAALESAHFIAEVYAELRARALQGDEPVTAANSVEILRQRLP